MDDKTAFGSDTETVAEAIARLSKLSHVEFGQVMKEEAAALECTVGELERDWKAARKGRKKQAALPADIEPWPEEVDGDALLDDLCHALRQYIVIEEKHLHTLVLWAVHTHCFQIWQNTPRLHVKAPKKRSGKTRTLELLEQITARPLAADGLTAPVVFRLTEDRHPTLLADEIDQWLDPQGELVGILNSGHSKGKKAYRCVGDENEVKEFDVFAPLALAGIGKIKSDTLADRAIAITIRRRLKTEPIRRFRKDRVTEFEPLRQQIARWVNDHANDLAAHDPDVPDIVDNDRLIDNWLPLLAIADVADGEWPDRARQIMTRQHTEAETGEEDGWDILLLKDLKDVFEDTRQDRLFTKEILTKLHLMGERPWPEFPNKQGPAKPITNRQVARLLEPHDIKPRLFKRPPDSPGRGYEKVDFEDTWTRYVSTTVDPVLSVTPLPPAENLAETGNAHDVGNVTDILSVTGKPAETLAGNGVTDKTPPDGDAHTYQLDLEAIIAARVREEGAAIEPEAADLEFDREERAAIESEPDPFDSISIPAAFRRSPSMAVMCCSPPG